jgi:hypothetical protein
MVTYAHAWIEALASKGKKRAEVVPSTSDYDQSTRPGPTNSLMRDRDRDRRTPIVSQRNSRTVGFNKVCDLELTQWTRC